MLEGVCCLPQVTSLHRRGGHLGKLGKAAWLFLLPVPTCALCAVKSLCSVLNVFLAGISGSDTCTCVQFWDLEMP